MIPDVGQGINVGPGMKKRKALKNVGHGEIAKKTIKLVQTFYLFSNFEMDKKP